MTDGPPDVRGYLLQATRMRVFEQAVEDLRVSGQIADEAVWLAEDSP